MLSSKTDERKNRPQFVANEKQHFLLFWVMATLVSVNNALRTCSLPDMKMIFLFRTEIHII